jgi:Nuclease-related domain
LVPARELKLRRPDTCVTCGCALPAGTPAWWDRTARTVTCGACWAGPQSKPAASPPPAAGDLDCGRPGASLDREYERRRRNRERRTREAHPHIGGLLLAMRGAPQHELAFRQGAVAERAVAESLDRRTADGPVIKLHNRRMPGGRGDIDHIAIAPTGVYVIDTKDWHGKVKIDTPWFGAPKLLIRGRDCTKLLDGLERQIAAVRAALDRHGHQEIPVQGALCFTKADLPFLRTQKLRGHLLLYRRALAKHLTAAGPLRQEQIEHLARELSVALPPAR